MNKPKILAFYLPQFHEIPENNEWWGKGFTEWVNVKKAKPLFCGHNQPRIPLNNNYYNLMDPKTFEWQVNNAKTFGIDGFCFYHYWFDGKLLLEKPLEMWLKHKEWKLNYCFSWANEPWARTWDGREKDVLMPQSYNGINDIKKHFEYMLEFFQDERYIKIDNKPVFVLYRANSIVYLSELVDVWNKLAIENGFSGIYFVETLTGFSKQKISEKTQATVYMEPMFVLEQRDFYHRFISVFRSPKFRNQRVSYKYLWHKILKEEQIGETTWAGAFCDWDNSPRKKKRNLVVTGVKQKTFFMNFNKLYKKVKQFNCPFIFINAWNEWAEGTYLEPDEKNKYMFLQAIKEITNE